MTKPLLELIGVEKSFGPNHVLRGVDIDVAPGRSLVILGGSGSGKSVMLKNALGLMTPDAGKIVFDGEDVTHDQGKEREAMCARVGMLFQSGALFDSLTVWENVAFRLLNADKMKRSDAKDQAIETLKKVRLGASVADLRPAEISGGMQKRVALARAIITKPDLIFFDEPTGTYPIVSTVSRNHEPAVTDSVVLEGDLRRCLGNMETHGCLIRERGSSARLFVVVNVKARRRTPFNQETPTIRE